jgi:hypothetical protein
MALTWIKTSTGVVLRNVSEITSQFTFIREPEAQQDISSVVVSSFEEQSFVNWYLGCEPT